MRNGTEYDDLPKIDAVEIVMPDKEEEERIESLEGKYPSDVEPQINSPIPNGVNKDNLDVFDRVKGHSLLGCCIAILVFIYLLEFIKTWITKQASTEISGTIVEIIKILIFSLTGYLFGTRDNKG